ncbi:ZEB2-regulated ABC transporter [Lachnellula suecica]|uniref:ZEB2-regulated ABC transporter n=1 Tax=Lachnellula suecica TaxID=602035 RepID=A0A8T9C5F7_9HELO|nr:ZEB2-regulated ABC transporter [Lachnellula suecica]
MDMHNRGESARKWLHQRQEIDRLRLGVSFQDLECHGFTTSTTFQRSVVSYALAFPRLFARLFSSQLPQRVQILSNLDGCVKPGEILLVLGRPGSGCSSFLKVLSGDTHGIHIGESSKINYAGISYDQMQRDFKGDSIYVAELDKHFPELTLGQTLTFAAATRETNMNHKATSQDTSRDVATLLGLRDAFDTKMGNALIRGVSGGETRRASISEALISGAQLQCWDNSTRGLDSSTAQKFIELLRLSTDELQSTAVMSIYQASNSMYNIFDKVMVLYEGRQIYFGPVESATDYFVELGFTKPKRATTADYLTSITSPAERRIREGFENQTPRSPDEFAAAWRRSSEAKHILEDISDFGASHPLQKVQRKQNQNDRSLDAIRKKMKLYSSTYLIAISQQTTICLQRGFLRLRNNYVPGVSAIFANAILAIIVGTVFYDLPNTTDSMDQRAVLIFFSLMICAFSPAFEVLTMWAQRPIVEKHNRYALYHPFTEGLAAIICDLPAKVCTSIMFHVTLYFMTNLRRSASAFFTYIVLMFFIVLTMSMAFRTLGSLSRTLEQTMAPASIIVLLCIVYTGFVIPVPYMKPWLSWFRRINPMAYAYESLMINEFSGRDFPCSSTIPTGPSYLQQAGMSGKVCPVVGAKPGNSEVQGSSYLLLKYGYKPSHVWRNFGIIVVFMIIFCVIHLLAVEYIPAQRSKGDLLLFQRGHIKEPPRRAPDRENTSRSSMFGRDSEMLFVQEAYVKRHDTAQPSSQQSSEFHWLDLSYEIRTKNGMKRLLKNIDGWVKPGTLTALMGVTGAGKTTLLDVLALRATFGTASGGIYIDGTPRDESFQRKIGYVQQEDIHVPTATVREALEFSALLRQPRTTSKIDKLNYVGNIIKLLDMDVYSEAVIGYPGNGLNIEQRKRLSIGIELVAKPELLLFLGMEPHIISLISPKLIVVSKDEPTSGLDSQTAWSMCMLLRKLADHGQAVLCTIHQPSSQLFRIFNRLLILSSEGETIYFGDTGDEGSVMIEYFESKGAPKCQPGENPAEWVLKVTSASAPDLSNSGPENSQIVNRASEQAGLKWAKAWVESQQHQDIKQYLHQSIVAKDSTSADQGFKDIGRNEYAESRFRQLHLVTRRIFQEYWRDPTYVYSKLGLCAGVCFFNGISFYNTSLDTQGFINFLFSIFLISQLFSTLDQQIIPRLADSRGLFEAREWKSKSYSWVMFLTANIVAEIFWQTIASVIIFVCWYYPTGLWRNGDPTFGAMERGGLVFMLIWLFGLWITTFSQAVGVGIEHAETAVQIATLCFWLSLVFCGLVLLSEESRL